MPNLGNYLEDVQFNQIAASFLVQELRGTSDILFRQIGDREQIGYRARASWEGSYAEQFDGRVKICMGDAERFVSIMRVAAQELEQLARLARLEQQRRVEVREGLARYEVVRAEFLAVGEPPPPVELFLPPIEPIEPPAIPVFDCPPTPRGSATPAGGR